MITLRYKPTELEHLNIGKRANHHLNMMASEATKRKRITWSEEMKHRFNQVVTNMGLQGLKSTYFLSIFTFLFFGDVLSYYFYCFLDPTAKQIHQASNMLMWR